ncbi:MAG: ATP-binding protein [Pseudonocardiaceae bacterium]
MIEGARQVGKSTLTTMVGSSRDSPVRYVTFDDAVQRGAALDDPDAFVDQENDGLLVLDEIQRVPELILPIKAAIDRDRRPGRFLMTGSADLLRLERTPDSLAGRAVTLPLRTLSRGELAGRSEDFVTSVLNGHLDPARFTTDTARPGYTELLASGGYPEAHRLSTRARGTWFDGYIDRIVQRDARDLRRQVDGRRLGAVLRLIAANQAGEIVKARLARDGDVPETTVRAYLDLLETLYLIEHVQPWTPNLTRRQTSKQKAIITDSGLAMHLAGITPAQVSSLTGGEMLGPLLEGLVVSELRKQATWSETRYSLFHYREPGGTEVDVVIELDDGRVLALEVKARRTYKPEQFRGLQKLADRIGDRFIAGIVLGTAPKGIQYSRNLFGLPIAALWE